jgi:tetratricopeptide (TPR) repeat protein
VTSGERADRPAASSARSLFESLVELGPAEREARLSAVTAEDPELARTVRALLAADAELPEDAFVAAGLPTGALPEAVAEVPPPSRVGPYLVLRRLGAGGMGEVFLARRDDGQFEQEVALKLLRPGLGTAQLVARFLRERQILARLEHPHIARLIDGGLAEDGRPYFAMEVVQGETLTEWCARRGSPIEERIGLLLTVCEAVEYAHRNLVVHRDLKPSNVLVTADGIVKLLDFGVAKVLESEEEGQATRTELRAMTPAYAAPEQVLGGAVSTATDVYSLGVLLFELLTGGLPHPRRGRTAAELAGEVTRETVERPSSRVAAGRTATDFERRRLARRLRGDLDTIALTALRREPERRYPSAASLATDLRAFLAGRPVTARPDTLGYRATKFVRRHRFGVGAAALLALAVAAGVAGTLHQSRVATLNARRAQRIDELLLDMFRSADPTQSAGATITARQILDQGAAKVAAELADDPELRAPMLDSLATVQLSLGLLPEAETAARQAVAARRSLAGDDVATAGSLALLGDALTRRDRLSEAEKVLGEAYLMVRSRAGDDAVETARVGLLFASLRNLQGDFAGAEKLARAALEVDERRLGRDHPETVGAVEKLGEVLSGAGRYVEAESYARRALAAREAVGGAGAYATSTAHLLLGGVLNKEKRFGDAVRELRLAVDLRRTTLGPDHPAVLAATIPLAAALGDSGDVAEARRLDEHVLEVRRRVGDRGGIAEVLNDLAAFDCEFGDFPSAERRFAEALSIWTEVLGPENPNTLMVQINQVYVLNHLGRAAEAEELGQRTLSVQRRIFGAGNPELVPPLNLVADALLQRGKIDEALALHREALGISSRLDPDGLEAGWGHTVVGLDLMKKFDAGDAASLAPASDEARLALAAFRRARGEEPPTLVDVLLLSGRVELAQGNATDARKLLGEALDLRQRQAGPQDLKAAQVELFLGLALRGAGEETEARRRLEASYATLRAQVGEANPWTRRAKAALHAG